MTGAVVTSPNGVEPQHMLALHRANDVRFHRANLRRGVRALDRDDARELLAARITEPPPWLEGMKVSAYLMLLPRVGPHHMRRVLARRRINELRTLQSLTLRQRLDLAGAIRGHWEMP